MNELERYRKELLLRELARRDLYTFLKLKWERYNRAEFLDNWHFRFLAELLKNTIHTQASGDKLITRLMLNMPPSYGKTETIARSFIAWALGNDPTRKFIYISYSDELCKKISNQVRDLIKSTFFLSIFNKKPAFLQDNSSEFVLREGGGLFVTTLKASLTGFHANQILIDDPIKVSEMSSRASRNLVNQNFKESVLSRLQNTESNITILMQRLGFEDLCGFLLDERNFEREIIDKWKIVKLRALNEEEEEWAMNDFYYKRPAGEALFEKKHNKEQLEGLKMQMGLDEFSSQYQQEPQASEAGFFEAVYFKEVPSYDLNENYEYIFVDNAISVEKSADNRAIVVLGVDRVERAERYVVKDVFFGIWTEEKTISVLIEALLKYPTAKCFIESDGAGLILHRLLEKEIVRVNERLKKQNQPTIANITTTYTPSRKVSKVEKIKAMKPYFNSGALVFLNTAHGLGQVKKELLGFNPAKPHRQDDCIDCIASAMIHPEVKAPFYSEKRDEGHTRPRGAFTSKWRI